MERTNGGWGVVLAALLAFATAAPVARAEGESADHVPAAGEPGQPGLAIKARKILICPPEGVQYVDNGVLLVREGKIEDVGPARTLAIPAGYEVLDAGDAWLAPGYIDLHSHVGGTFDINDAVFLANPGLRASTAVIPANPGLKKAVAAGVTSILFIPGSATNMGGWGVLFKTGLDRFEDALIRQPGSLKLAQAGNPEGWTVGVGRTFMNWNTRDTFERGLAYARAWKAYDAGKGPLPDRIVELDIFRHLEAKEAQISTHTQIYQVVLATLTMVKRDLGLDVFIDHGEMAGYKLAKFAQDLGVNAILGPRNIEVPTRQFINWTGSNPEAILGIAAEYQKQGHKNIGFNTDAPVVPQEELFLQATMGARYGMDISNLETVRGLTIVPAMTMGIDDRIGSLEKGKEADVLILTGDPGDPRTFLRQVFIEGRKVYDTAVDRRRF